MTCKHPDLIVQRNNGERWVTCTECLVDFVSDGYKEYKHLNDEQRALYDVIMQFKSDDTSPLAAALNVIMNHAKTIRKQHDTIVDFHDKMEPLIEQARELRETASIITELLNLS
jgi:hypothetical protein